MTSALATILALLTARLSLPLLTVGLSLALLSLPLLPRLLALLTLTTLASCFATLRCLSRLRQGLTGRLHLIQRLLQCGLRR